MKRATRLKQMIVNYMAVRESINALASDVAAGRINCGHAGFTQAEVNDAVLKIRSLAAHSIADAQRELSGIEGRDIPSMD
jgi:hypothetical protein